MANTIVKTPIVYYGGKTSIINHILPLVPVHEVYTETFFGGGTLFWAKDPVKNETINDRLDFVINFYRVLKLHYPKLKRLINATLISRTMHAEANQIIRDHRRGKKVDKIYLAWAFWFASNFSHMNKINGGYKQEKGGGRSVPKQLHFRKEEFTEWFVHRIENVCIENTDWKKVANARNCKEAYHYLDPPYVGTYTAQHHKFTSDNQEELLDWCANDCKGKFTLSNYNSELLDRYVLDNNWFKREVTHQLKTARKSGTTKTEVLVYNYPNTCGTLKLFN